MTNQNLERVTQIQNKDAVSEAIALLQRVRFFGEIPIDRAEYDRTIQTLRDWERDLWGEISGWVYGGGNDNDNQPKKLAG